MSFISDKAINAPKRRVSELHLDFSRTWIWKKFA